MEKLSKKPHLWSLATNARSRSELNGCDRLVTKKKRIAAAVFTVAVSFSLHAQIVEKNTIEKNATEKNKETYQDLIQKAQNLTLQQDRLQTSQVLIRGLQREVRGSVPYKDLVRALDQLSGVFFSEKGQNQFSNAESLVDSKPREAIEAYQETLKSEDQNLSTLKALARVHLRLDECDRADHRVKQAEAVNPYSAEVHLLRLQTLACQKNFEVLATRLAAHDSDLEPVEGFLRGLQLLDLFNRKEFKKAKTLVGSWEAKASDYPEVYFWKWRVSKNFDITDRAAATKYSQLCQGLSVRKKKNFGLDVDLCKGKTEVEAFLKESENLTQAPITKPEGAR